MTYKNLRECVEDLELGGRLIRITSEVDPHLEMAEIHRRVNQAGGPAVLYARVKGSPFPAVSNLYGTMERARYLFRETLERTQKALRLKADPFSPLKKPIANLKLPLTLLRAIPRRTSDTPVLEHQTTLDQLPQIQCWPEDGGAFITLPQVYTENPDRPALLKSNLGMYRIQISGGQYQPNREAGMHYQIHRGIGAHHSAAILRGEKLKVSIFIGGPPSHTLAAVMPLPEGISELTFAGMLAGRNFTYTRNEGHLINAQADFCITGTVDPKRTLPEGPFGDHLGYYSLAHDFPVLEVERVTHRSGAIWPFTVVGRPPQEDSVFGKLIHELTGDLIPGEIPGVKALHAVDAAGIHPLLLAVGRERYVPYAEKRPMELLTQANAILGFGQCSLAKYLLIADGEKEHELDLNDIPRFFSHVLERIRWEEDLHFQTRTTIDTLDYSGSDLNAGSKLVIAAAGKPRRTLGKKIPSELSLPAGFKNLKWVHDGILAVTGPEYRTAAGGQRTHKELCRHWKSNPHLASFPLVVIADDAGFISQSFRNFLWVTFTRSNPAVDINGVGGFNKDKHWGCTGPLIIDARSKPRHAPVLEPDPDVVKRVDTLGALGGPLHGVI